MFDPAIQPNVDIRREAHFNMTFSGNRPVAKITAWFHLRKLLRLSGGMGVILLCLSGFVNAQLPAGVLNSTNYRDWQHSAGVIGGIPSAGWSQCGSTISPYTGTAATINSAISACAGLNEYVLLGPGTFTISTAINWGNKSGVVLRGSGATSTFIVFGSGASVNCGENTALICANSSSGVFPGTGGFTLVNWTAGFSQGGTTVTVASTSGVVAGSTLVVLTQCNTGLSGNGSTTPGCGTGTEVDNGGYYDSGAQCVASGINCSSGSSQSGPDTGQGVANRFQMEVHTITNVNSGTGVLTLGESLIHPNWASGSSPQVYFIGTSGGPAISNDGLENLSIDGTASSGFYGISFFSAYNVWVQGVRFVNPAGAPISMFQGTHFTFQNNYMFEEHGSDDFTISIGSTSDGLIQNNIFHQHNAGVVEEGPDSGTVIAYNYGVGMCNYLYSGSACRSDNLTNTFRPHANGDDYELYEGNVAPDYYADGTHGTHLSQTLFRNFFAGWESCGISNTLGGNGPCGATSAKDFLTIPFTLAAYQGRYHYSVGNVLGTPGYHNQYAFTTGFCWTSTSGCIYNLGAGYGNGGSSPLDAKVGFGGTSGTGMSWGNFDVATNAIRWCGNSSDTGWSTTCSSTSEVPAAAPTFPNSVPTLGDTGAGMSVMPASFYLASKPSWFGTNAWPAIGPDVSSGLVEQCTGTLNTNGQFSGVAALTNTQCGGHGIAAAWGGHVNPIPAMSCYFAMGGTADGTGSAALTGFNATNCPFLAAGSSSATAPSCSPGSGNYPTSQSVVCTNPNSGTTVMCYTTNGTTPATNGAGTACSTGTAYTTTLAVTVPETLTVIAGTSTLTDSSTVAYVYTFTIATPTLNPPAGTYPISVSPAITAQSGATICYTLDGSTPLAATPGTCSHGTTISSGTAVTITSSGTVKAIGTAVGLVNSAVGSAAYVLLPPPSNGTPAIILGDLILQGGQQ